MDSDKLKEALDKVDHAPDGEFGNADVESLPEVPPASKKLELTDTQKAKYLQYTRGKGGHLYNTKKILNAKRKAAQAEDFEKAILWNKAERMVQAAKYKAEKQKSKNRKKNKLARKSRRK